METTSETSEIRDLGKLTPEEHAALLKIKADSAQYLIKIGEFEVMKARCLGKLDQMDREGQTIMDTISKRLGLNPGQQWQALQDGTLRLVPSADLDHTQSGVQ